MKRREFMQGALAVAAAVLLSKAIQQSPAPLPAWSWNHSEEAGRRLREELAKGINRNAVFFPSKMPAGQIFWSDDGGTTWKPMTDDGGRFTWEASSIGFGAD